MVTAAWDRFWFKPIDARQYAALRIAFGSLSLIYFWQLLPYTETEFSAAGWLGAIKSIPQFQGGSWSLLFLPGFGQSPVFAFVLISVGMLAALLMTIGWHSRFACGITWLVWVSLWNRNPLLLDGDDAVLKLMCAYLLLAPCGNCWSLDAYMINRPEYVAIWPLRLIQFQIALLYFVSGWVKFHSQDWLDGKVLQIVLIHPHYSRWDGWAIMENQGVDELLGAVALCIRWWELLFPFLLLSAYTRRWSLIIGVLFHLSLLLTMNLRWFAVIMLALYLALLPNGVFVSFEKMFKTNKSIE